MRYEFISAVLNSCRMISRGEAHRSPAIAVQLSHYGHRYIAHERIPLLGTAVNKDPELQLLRLFASLDAPVDDLVIVHGQDDPIVDKEIEYILLNVDNATRVTVLRYPGYLGCAEAWNAVFTAVPTAPWGVFAASDTAFTKGALGMLARKFWPLVQPGVAIAAGVTWTNPGMPPGGWGTWALSRGGIERCDLQVRGASERAAGHLRVDVHVGDARAVDALPEGPGDRGELLPQEGETVTRSAAGGANLEGSGSRLQPAHLRVKHHRRGRCKPKKYNEIR